MRYLTVPSPPVKTARGHSLKALAIGASLAVVPGNGLMMEESSEDVSNTEPLDAVVDALQEPERPASVKSPQAVSDELVEEQPDEHQSLVDDIQSLGSIIPDLEDTTDADVLPGDENKLESTLAVEAVLDKSDATPKAPSVVEAVVEAATEEATGGPKGVAVPTKKELEIPPVMPREKRAAALAHVINKELGFPYKPGKGPKTEKPLTQIGEDTKEARPVDEMQPLEIPEEDATKASSTDKPGEAQVVEEAVADKADPGDDAQIGKESVADKADSGTAQVGEESVADKADSGDAQAEAVTSPGAFGSVINACSDLVRSLINKVTGIFSS
eukprot:Blabericola_migrator_1__11771@NODE_712_length_6764_cov_120_789757_g501_i1_p4_GENE_NODE_712_length_6764_cov_120_789757_g501_i1NODE_712_length_6764_cov_120_789757_g501_i1_p4_ORF_typecomplete_len329_score88_94_NODE_712_length_6764_cov_120_789757_g501_i11211107